MIVRAHMGPFFCLSKKNVQAKKMVRQIKGFKGPTPRFSGGDPPLFSPARFARRDFRLRPSACHRIPGIFASDLVLVPDFPGFFASDLVLVPDFPGIFASDLVLVPDFPGADPRK